MTKYTFTVDFTLSELSPLPPTTVLWGRIGAISEHILAHKAMPVVRDSASVTPGLGLISQASQASLVHVLQ